MTGTATPDVDAGTGMPSPDEDVVALLIAQHGEIRNLFDAVERCEGEQRRDTFRELVHMLAVHETAEEEVVHPYARRVAEGGAQIVDDRLEEEKQAKELLSRLEGLDPNAEGFMPLLRKLRTAVTEHARTEERYEFAQLRRIHDRQALATMAQAVKAAEATAPTHPHPGVESGAENIALGPMAAIVDRTRDAIRKATGTGG
jgi:hemerythrin superfamily protein